MKQLIKGLFSQILLLIVLFSTSCSEQKNEKSLKIIDVAGSVGGGRIIDISEVVEDIRYIPLETTEYSLVGEGVRVSYEKGRIYITDRTSILKIFDNEGKFLRNFDRRGRGPLEYPNKVNLYVEPKSGNILIDVVDGNASVYKYDQEGRYLGKFKTPQDGKYKTMWPIWLDDNTYVARIGLFLDKPDFSVVAYDSLGQIKLLVPMPKLPPYKVFAPRKPVGLLNPTDGKIVYERDESGIKKLENPDRTILYRFRNNMRIVYESYDTVLSITTKMKIDTPYIFNYGKYRNNSMERSSISASKGKHISLCGRNQIMESDDYLFMQLALRDFAHEPYGKINAKRNETYAINDSYAIFNKKKSKFSFLNQIEKGVLGFRENLMDGPPFWPVYISDDNSLVMVIPALTLIEYAETHTISPKLAEIVKNLKDTDNPVVVIAR